MWPFEGVEKPRCTLHSSQKSFMAFLIFLEVRSLVQGPSARRTVEPRPRPAGPREAGGEGDRAPRGGESVFRIAPSRIGPAKGVFEALQYVLDGS